MINLKQLITSKKATLLGLGPMSINSIQAIVELANQVEIPTQLIASRRQIDCKKNGGGYVGGLCTETFIPLVREMDKKKMIMISRDHGGPWQNYAEIQNKLTTSEAMASAKASFANDIELGMDAIHIDPSFDPNGVSKDQVNERILELFEFCLETSKKEKKNPLYEIGSEQQVEGFENHREFNDFIMTIVKRLRTKGMPMPNFVVLQTGTKVMDTSNHGDLVKIIQNKRDITIEKGIGSLEHCLKDCERLGIMAKSHNGDYLNEETLHFFPKHGVHAINIAPELGVLETSFIFKSLLDNDMTTQYEALVNKIIELNKWDKWIHPNCPVNEVTKARVSGHYHFENFFFKEFKSELAHTFASKGNDLDIEIKKHLKERITLLYRALNWKTI